MGSSEDVSDKSRAIALVLGGVLVPDFDFAGAVDARYATPNPDVGIRRVRDRVYRGFCRDELDPAPLYALFNERKDSIYAMVQGFEELEEKQRKRLLDYYDGFYDVIDNEGRARRQIEQMCRRA